MHADRGDDRVDPPGARRRVAGDQHRQQVELRLQRVAVGDRVGDDDGGEDPRRVHPPQGEGAGRPDPGDHEGVRLPRRPPPLAEQVERREPRHGDDAAGEQVLDDGRASSPPDGHAGTVPTAGPRRHRPDGQARLRRSTERPCREPAARLARRPMRPTPVLPDARPVPSLAEQLRSARHRRARRRRAALVALVAVPAALLGARARRRGDRRARRCGVGRHRHHAARPLDDVDADRPPPRAGRRVRAGAGRRRRRRARPHDHLRASGPPRSRRRCSRPRSPSGDRSRRRCGGSSRPTGRCTCRAWRSTSATGPPPTGSPTRAPASASAGPWPGSGGTSSGASAGRRRARARRRRRCPRTPRRPGLSRRREHRDTAELVERRYAVPARCATGLAVALDDGQALVLDETREGACRRSGRRRARVIARGAQPPVQLLGVSDLRPEPER